MIEPFEYPGTWWSPKYRRRVHGDLVFSAEDGVQLVVQGSLTPNQRQPLHHHPIILGRAAYSGHGSQVTLLNAVSRGWSEHGFPGPPIVVERFDIGHALLGAHLRSPADSRFHSAEIAFQHLGDWVNRYGFATSRATQQPYTVTYERQPTIETAVDGGVLRIDRIVSHPAGHSHEIHLTERLSVNLKFDDAVDIPDLHSLWIYPLQNFITLAVNTGTWVTKIDLFNNRFRYRGKRHLRPLSMFYRQTVRPNEQRVTAPHFSRRLFNFTDVESRLGDVLRHWLQTYQDLRSPLEVYFGDRYHPQFRRARLLALVLALESMHRATHSNTLRSKSEFRSLVTDLVAAVPQAHQQWLREQLAYSNELRLRDRIFQLSAELVSVMEPLVGDLGRFAGFVAKARNDVAHAAGARRAVTDDQMYWLIQQLEILCQAFLLSRMGLSTETITSLFERNESYAIVRKYGKTPFEKPAG